MKNNEELRIKLNEESEKNRKLKDENEKLKSELSNLKQKLEKNDAEIKDLKTKISNNEIEKQKYYLYEIMVISFISEDKKINEPFTCLATDIFVEVEKKLYEKYTHLKNANYIFKVNEKTILRFKTLKENEIKNKDKIHF